MAEREVTHIERDGPDTDRRIDLFEGPDWGPRHVDDVVLDIQSGEHSYFVRGLFSNVPLEAMYPSTAGRWYVRTVPNGMYDDNLHELPEIGAPRRLGTLPYPD